MDKFFDKLKLYSLYALYGPCFFAAIICLIMSIAEPDVRGVSIFLLGLSVTGLLIVHFAIDARVKDAYEVSKIKQSQELLSLNFLECETQLEKAKKELKELRLVRAENEHLLSVVSDLGNNWINDSWRTISGDLNHQNYATQVAKLEKIFSTCKKLGLEFDTEQEAVFFSKLKDEWQNEIRVQKAKDEQSRLREMMREEQKIERERQQELKRIAQREKELLAKRVEQAERLKILRELEALKSLTEEQKLELERVSAQNSELEQEILDNQRQMSMAQLTKAGHVYVISNVGSFGEKVFKIGMTRRLVPEERVKELGDASVPFPFDIHMMIPSEDAPKLEHSLHELLWNERINLVNDGREFFNISLDEIKKAVDLLSPGTPYFYESSFVASQWRESMARREKRDFGTYSDDVELPEDDEDAA